jgi:citrate lyase subunit beta / citryl-CoA lyase
MTDQQIFGTLAKGDIRVELSRGGPAENEIIITETLERQTSEYLSALVRETLKRLGITNSTITIADQSHADWIVTARIEAAAKQLYPDQCIDPLLATPTNRLPSRADQRRNILLQLPGNRPHLWRLDSARPDTLIFDLTEIQEAEKEAARILVRNVLSAVAFEKREPAVRIRPLPDGLRDLPAIIPQHPSMILVSETENPQAITETTNAINQIATRHGIMDPIWVVPVIETAKGVLAAPDIAQLYDQVPALLFDTPRFSAHMGAALTDTGDASYVARSQVLLAARAAGLQALDLGLTVNAGEAEQQASAKAALELGYDGIGCHTAEAVDQLRTLFPAPAEGATKLKGVE